MSTLGDGLPNLRTFFECWVVLLFFNNHLLWFFQFTFSKNLDNFSNFKLKFFHTFQGPKLLSVCFTTGSFKKYYSVI